MTFPIASHLPFLRNATRRLARRLPAWDQEDIVQDTCVRVLSTRPTCPTADTQRLYLHACLVNVLKNRWTAAHTAKRYGAEVSITALHLDHENNEKVPAHHPPALRSPPAQEHHVLLGELLRDAPALLIRGGTHVQPLGRNKFSKPRTGPREETPNELRTRKLLRAKFRKDYAP